MIASADKSQMHGLDPVITDRLTFSQGTDLPSKEEVSLTLRKNGLPEMADVGSNSLRCLLWIDFRCGQNAGVGTMPHKREVDSRRHVPHFVSSAWERGQHHITYPS